MPFQDIDESEPVEVQTPSPFERFMRRVFVEDLGIKLLALGITLFIWVAVTGENNPKTIRTGVQINFVLPAGLQISNDPPRVVDVMLTGRKTRLDNLRMSDLVATIDLSDAQPGERVIRLAPPRVELALPEGVKVESFEPGGFSVRLEPTIERAIPVEVRLTGTPAEGFVVQSFAATLTSARVRGPLSLVNRIEKASTEPIALDGRKEGFLVPSVPLDTGEPKVELIDTAVDVSISIGAKPAEPDGTSLQEKPGEQPGTTKSTAQN